MRPELEIGLQWDSARKAGSCLLPASARCYLGAALSCTLDGMLALGNSERLIRPDQAPAPIRAMPGHTPLAKIGDYWRACDYQDLRGDFKRRYNRLRYPAEA